MVPLAPASRRQRRSRRRRIAAVAVAAMMSSVLVACGGGSEKPVLTWYINPDPDPPPDFEGAFGLEGIAERCSTDAYDIKTEQLPTAATEQRIQLMRRLAANDSSIDLMSLDPIFTAEFAEAGYLAELSEEDQKELREGALEGAVEAATWKDELVVAPQWANTQLLWYRKSVAEKAGLDMSKPVTWDQIIEAAEKTDSKVSIQGNKYEGYVVLDQRFDPGRRRQHRHRAREGRGHVGRARLRGRARGSGSHREAGGLLRRRRRHLRLQRGHGRGELQRRHRRLHGQLDLHLPRLRRDPQGRPRLRPLPAAPSRARSPSPRPAASTSGSAPSATTRRSPSRPRSASRTWRTR